MNRAKKVGSHYSMKPIHVLFITTVLAACVLLIPYIGYWFLPIVLPAIVGIMVIHRSVSERRPLRDIVRPTLIASIGLTLFALLQGLNVQRCLDIGRAEKGVLASEVMSCRVFGMYSYSSDKFSSWPIGVLVLIVLPTAVFVLLISLVYLMKTRIRKSS